MGNTAGDAVEVIQLEFDTSFVRNGQDVENGVGRAAQGHDNRDGIFEGLLRHDLAGRNAAIQKIQHGDARGVRVVIATRVNRRSRG